MSIYGNVDLYFRAYNFEVQKLHLKLRQDKNTKFFIKTLYRHIPYVII